MERQWSLRAAEADENLIREVYPELREMAARLLRRERHDHTLQRTALVHEAFIRLFGKDPDQFLSVQKFLAIAAHQMREILIDYSRKHRSQKRGSEFTRVPLFEADLAVERDYTTAIALDAALKCLADIDERAVLIVELKFFGGYTTAKPLRFSRFPIARWKPIGSLPAPGYSDPLRTGALVLRYKRFRMTPEDLGRMKSAQVEALALSPEKRDEFLRTRFRKEPELLEGVRELLHWNENAGNFLKTPIATRFAGPSARDLEIRRVGPYELVRELGRGGSSTVYLARRADDLFEKLVAIKLLNRLSHSEEDFRRFQREIQVLARLEHPYIVRLLEAGITGEALAYIETEFVDGQPISEYAAGLPLRDKLLLFLKVCEGVAFAHRNLIVHRDIKPTNILVTQNGTPKLLDFGIALILDQNSVLTVTGLERMTVQYASPEQIRRDRNITTSSDVYALGVLLYELISGRSPYAGPTHELPLRILSDEPIPLSEGPRDLGPIVRMALQKAPADRYDSVAHLRDDVELLLAAFPFEPELTLPQIW